MRTQQVEQNGMGFLSRAEPWVHSAQPMGSRNTIDTLNFLVLQVSHQTYAKLDGLEGCTKRLDRGLTILKAGWGSVYSV